MAEAAHEIANAAAKAAWPDKQNTEPLSGASGDVSKGEPFDAGNLDPESQEKLRRSMSGEDNNDDNNYTTSGGGNSGAREFDQSMGTGSAPGATFAGGSVTATNMHGVPADKDVPSSTRDTGFGVDPGSSKDDSARGNTANVGSASHSSGNPSTLHTNTGAPVGASTNNASAANSRDTAGAAAGSFAGVNTTSDIPASTRDTGYGIDPNNSRDVSGSNTGSSPSNIPVSASAPAGTNTSGSQQQNLGTNTSTYDGSTRTPSNTISSSHQTGAGTAVDGIAATSGSNVPSATTRDTGYGIDPNQSREVGSQSNTSTHRSQNTTSHSEEINRAAHDHGAAGAAGAALGVAVGGTSAADSSTPSSTRDTGYGVDPSASDGNPAPGFNTMTPNTKLADPSGTSRDFSGNNNSTSSTRDISDNASTRALASNSNKDLPSTGDSTRGENPEDELVDVDGPGPRPLAEVAAEHGGDAGKSAADEQSTTSGKKGLADATDEPKHDEVKAEGTGEKWVKTSGLAADGGDFDATKPGAGREADRLMEQKGMKTEDSDPKGSQDKDSKGHGHDDKDKPGLVERIKEKLHKH